MTSEALGQKNWKGYELQAAEVIPETHHTSHLRELSHTKKQTAQVSKISHLPGNDNSLLPASLRNTMEVLTPSDISNEQLKNKHSKNARVTKNDGSHCFGIMPRLCDVFPEGEIILKLGFHGFFDRKSKSVKNAFGLRHIWDEHGEEIKAESAQDVVAFVESVLQSGAEILIDYNKAPSKPLIVESRVGMVIVELRCPQGENPYYSIITAYARKGHPGTLMGNLQ